MFFEMGLTHSIKVTLRLFLADRHLTEPRFGTVTLTETLRLDDLIAARHPTEPTLVLYFGTVGSQSFFFFSCGGGTIDNRRRRRNGRWNGIAVFVVVVVVVG